MGSSLCLGRRCFGYVLGGNRLRRTMQDMFEFSDDSAARNKALITIVQSSDCVLYFAVTGDTSTRRR